MSGHDLTLEEWLNVALEATARTAASTLASERVEVTGRTGRMPQDPAGAYVALLADDTRLHVGLLSNETGFRSLARSFLCLEPGAEDPSREDVADAVGEIVNIVAGIMKREVTARVPRMELGLPIFVRGQVVASPRSELAVAAVCIDTIKVDLVMLRGGSGGAEAPEETKP